MLAAIYPATSGVGQLATGALSHRLAAIGDVAGPAWRASAIGVYRLWRDLGYAIGAVVAGITADRLGLAGAIWLVAAITAASGVLVAHARDATSFARVIRVLNLMLDKYQAFSEVLSHSRAWRRAYRPRSLRKERVMKLARRWCLSASSGRT